MKACPGCQQSIADVLGRCPFCAHVFPEADATPALDPALLALDATRERRPGPRFLRACLLIVSLLLALCGVLIVLWQ